MVKIIENYVLSELIGEGSFSTVYKAKHKLNEKLYAVKIIPIEKFLQNQKLEECICNEIEILTTIGATPHIIQYFQKFKTKKNYYFIYEYCNGGNLFQLIKNQKQIPETRALQIFTQVLEAFKILNRYNIMHRDIKPQNILFNDGVVKLADFGFCKGMKPDENLTKTMLGSPIYMAPQILKGESYTTKADIWSLGVLLFQMIFGFCPYNSYCIASLINTIENQTLKFPPNVEVSERTTTLIKRMLTKDYFRRMSWVELFGVKIDSNGNYENESSLSEVSNMIEKRSTSHPEPYKKKNFFLSAYQLSEHPIFAKQPAQLEERKMKKQEKKKVFYSQNYMDILTKPIEKSSPNIGSPAKQVDQETHDETQKPSSLLEQPKELNYHKSLDYIKIQTEKQRREDLIKIHETCVQVLGKTLTMLEIKGSEVLSDGYVILKWVHKKLKNITQQIKITETNLLDMASIINYEIIQVDRMLIEMRNQLLKLKTDIPQMDGLHLSEEVEGKFKLFLETVFLN